jgi:hypothetical protein
MNTQEFKKATNAETLKNRIWLTLIQETFPNVEVEGNRLTFYSDKMQILSFFCERDTEEITAIDKGAGFNSNVIKNITETVEKYLKHIPSISYDTDVFFCFNSVNESYSFQKEFQILPPIAGFPVPAKGNGNSAHPFIFEFSYSKIGLSNFDLDAIEQTKRKWLFLLNLILNCSVWRQEQTEVKWCWVSYGEKHECKELPVGYFPTNFQKKVTRFTDIEASPKIKLEDDLKYYGDIRSSNTVLTMPLGCEEMFSKFLRLSQVDQDRFVKAAEWFYLGNQSRNLGKTIPFICYTTAIETILPKAKQIAECPECKLPKYDKSNRQRMIDLFETQAGISKEVTNEILKLRNTVLHDGKNLSLDRFSWSVPTMMFDYDKDVRSYLYQKAGCRAVLLKWLKAHA